MKKWLSLLVTLVAVIYRDSFTSPFFQDDRILLNLPLTPIANFPYRPLSQPIFYQLNYVLFGLNPLGFHLVLFLFFTGTVFLIFSLAKQILKTDLKAFVATVFYAANISLFANFYWIATSYFTVGAFFFFLTIYLYLHKKALAAFLSFLLALGSNEMAFILPIIFLLLGWFRTFWPKSLWLYFLFLPVLLVGRLVLGLPQAVDYTLSLNFLPTLRWYLFRALNLPEGVQRTTSPALYFVFVIFILLFVVSLLRYRKISFRLLIFGLAFFLLGALPFFFLPGHMSSYYLTIALFGPALIFGEIVSGKKLTALILVSYLALTVLGLEFLSQTHWIILKNTGPIGKF